MNSSMHGTCLCGKIAFDITGSNPNLYQCHCSLCRKQGGSSSNSGLIVEAEKIQWRSGQAHISSYTKNTGFRSNFCSSCGSPVPNPLRDTQYYWIPVGLLDDSDQLKICAHIYVESKASWDSIPASGVHFKTMPDMQEFYKLLHADISE